MNASIVTRARVSVVGPALLYLVIVLSGILLGTAGQPYSTMVLSIHKLIALGAVLVLGRTIYLANRAAGLSGTELAACVATGLLLLGTIASGGLLATESPMPAAVSTMHQVLPFLTVLSSAVALYSLRHR